MRVEVVDHEDPTLVGGRRNRIRDVGNEVAAGAGLCQGWRDDFAGGQVKVGREAERSVPCVPGLLPHGMPRTHGPLTMALDRLHTRLFVTGDNPDTAGREHRGGLLHLDNVANLLGKLRLIVDLGLHPVPTPVRL